MHRQVVVVEAFEIHRDAHAISSGATKIIMQNQIVLLAHAYSLQIIFVRAQDRTSSTGPFKDPVHKSAHF